VEEDGGDVEKGATEEEKDDFYPQSDAATAAERAINPLAQSKSLGRPKMPHQNDGMKDQGEKIEQPKSPTK